MQFVKAVRSGGKKYAVPVLVGLTSFGIACATEVPGVYVNTTTYLDFIKTIVYNY
jgi:hypothetical protein